MSVFAIEPGSPEQVLLTLHQRGFRGAALRRQLALLFWMRGALWRIVRGGDA